MNHDKKAHALCSDGNADANVVVAADAANDDDDCLVVIVSVWVVTYLPMDSVYMLATEWVWYRVALFIVI